MKRRPGAYFGNRFSEMRVLGGMVRTLAYLVADSFMVYSKQKYNIEKYNATVNGKRTKFD